ncbi:hypothetical protein [Marinibactrum halimedae]|nr:hypothetical protein [Marinibactrum halimedae]MCD9461178.1 hypothetical protein [Marinibactrum halimedae]
MICSPNKTPTGEISHDQQGREIARQHSNGLLSEKSYDPKAVYNNTR